MAYFGCIKKSAGPPAPEPNYLYKWDFTKSVDPLVDEIQGQVAVPYNDITLDFDGLHFGDNGDYNATVYLGQIYMPGKTIEIEVGNAESRNTNSTYCNLVSYTTGNGEKPTYPSWGPLTFLNGGCYYTGILATSDSWTKKSYGLTVEESAIKNKTVKIINNSDKGCSIYLDGDLWAFQNDIYWRRTYDKYLWLGPGGYKQSTSSTGDNNPFPIKNLCVKSVKIYLNEDYNYEWDLTNSIYDIKHNIPIDMWETSQTINGIAIEKDYAFIKIPVPITNGMTYEFDIASMDKQFNSSTHGRLIMPTSSEGFIFRHQTQQWAVYFNGTWYADDSGSELVTNYNVFNGKTLKFLYENKKLCVYADDDLVYRCPLELVFNDSYKDFMFGSTTISYYNVTITGIRIHPNEEV